MALNIPYITASQFVASFASAVISISSGGTGVVTTLTPPPGERVRLTGLASGGTDHVNDTIIKVSGVDILTGLLLQVAISTPAAGELVVGFVGSTQEDVLGGIDEVITINVAVAHTQAIIYSYQFGA